MRLKLTLLLIALNVALASFIFYFDKVQSTRSLFDASSRLILNPDFVQGLDRIRITSVHLDSPWILEKQEDAWLVASPIQWKANRFAVDQLLFQLRQLSWESRFTISDVRDSGQSLQAYNLEAPPIRIDLGNDAVSLSLSLGAPTEIGNRLYLMSPNGDYIYVVPRALLDVLQRDLEAFLDRRVFGMSEPGIRALQIQDRATSNVRVRLERMEDRWEFVSPMATPADRERVETMIQEWQSLEVSQFEAGGAGPMELNGDSMRLTFEGLGQRETLIMAPVAEGLAGQGGKAYLAKREAFPAVFKLDSALVEELRRVQENLRERRVMSPYSAGWTSLEVHFEGLNLTLQQLEGGSWQVLYTDRGGELRTLPAAREAVDTMQTLLAEMEVTRFVSDAPSEADLARFGLMNPQRRLVLRMPTGALVEFRIGGVYPDEAQTLLYAMTNQSSSVFLVRPHVLAAMPLDPFHYRERTIRTLPATVSLEDVAVIFRSSGLSLQTSALGEEEGEKLEGMLRTYLRNTRIDRFLNREFADPLPLDVDRQLEWPYLLEAKMVYPSNPAAPGEVIRLYLTERLGGNTQYVGDPLTRLVGTLPPDLIEALDPLLARFPDEPVPPEAFPETAPPPDPEADMGDTVEPIPAAATGPASDEAGAAGEEPAPDPVPVP